MKGAIAKAQELVGATPGAWMPQQFENPANIEVHARTTAQEILADFPEGLDALITGVGTGGHITGCARVLKKAWPKLKVFAVEPTASPVISGGEPSPHPIQGIGAGFIPENLDTALLDGVIQVEADAAEEMARRAAREEGMLVGISSGATLAAIAQKLPDLPPGAACSASTTTPASAICRSRDSCRPSDLAPDRAAPGRNASALREKARDPFPEIGGRAQRVVVRPRHDLPALRSCPRLVERARSRDRNDRVRVGDDRKHGRRCFGAHRRARRSGAAAAAKPAATGNGGCRWR